MKRIISLILIMVLSFMIASVSFAAKDTQVQDPKIPGAPAENVNRSTYVLPQRVVGDENVPGSATVVDEQTPKGDALPKTGGIPAETFYAAGILIIAVALVILKKTKAAPKHE